MLVCDRCSRRDHVRSVAVPMTALSTERNEVQQGRKAMDLCPGCISVLSETLEKFCEPLPMARQNLFSAEERLHIETGLLNMEMPPDLRMRIKQKVLNAVQG